MTVRSDIYAGGAWVPSAATASIEVENPATEAVVAAVPDGVPADVDRAVAAAREAFGGWSNTPHAERASLLGALRDGVRARQPELAAAITAEMGAPTRLALAVHTALPIAVLDSYVNILGSWHADERIGNSLVTREAAGVVGAITPWNFPLHQAINKIAPALAAGCTVVHKPSEVAPLSAYLFAEIAASAGLPAGVYNLVSGVGATVGEALAGHRDVDVISFTGSTRAGKRVAALASKNVTRVALELGGKSANIILADADVGTVVGMGVANCFFNSGQACNAWTRMLVPRARHDEVVDLAVAAAAKYTVGDPTDPGTRLGPLASRAQRERVRGYISRGLAEGARLVAGGADAAGLPERGYYVAPTVFAGVAPESTIAQEEIFGPVLCVIAYDDEDDAVRIANDTEYGLSGAVWSGDDDHAVAVARRLRTGQVDINGGTFNPLAPFGGFKHSGYGRELGRFGLEEFLQLKSLQLPA
jgi:aldehyde dehydrogenase (NAD+)